MDIRANGDGDGTIGAREAWAILAALWLGLPLLILAYKAGLDFLLGKPVLEGLARLSGARFALAVATVNLLLSAAFAAVYWRELSAYEAWRAWLLAPPARPGPPPSLSPAAYPVAMALLFRPLLALARRISPARGHLFGAPAAALFTVALVAGARRLFRRRGRTRRP